MTDDSDVVEDRPQRAQIDEFFAQELSRAGYGGMDVAKTPMGTQIVLKAEKPGMVIGKGGENIRKVTTALKEKFNLEDPRINVQEIEEPDLNARIVADRLANALERGWYFRKAGHTTIDRIMEAGALGAEIILSGKVVGTRSRVEKFTRGYIKQYGESAEEFVDHGQSVAVMELGTIGVDVKIIPPDAELPDDFEVSEDMDTVRSEPEAESIKELLGGKPGSGDEAVETKEEADLDEVEILDDLQSHTDYFAHLYALNEFSQNDTIQTDSELKRLKPEDRDLQEDYRAIRTIIKKGRISEDLAEHFAKELSQLKIKEIKEESPIQSIDEEGVVESMKQMIMMPA